MEARYRRALGFFLATLFLLSGCGLEPGLSEDKALPISADLVIIGDGIGGLAASLEASRRGASVVLFSGEPPVERWMWEEGFLSPGKSAGSFKKLMADCGWSGYQKWHFDLLYRNAPEDLAWLFGETGLQVEPGSHRLIPKNLSYDQVHSLLKEKASQEGVRFIEGAVLEELLQDGNSVAGAGFTDPAGVHNDVYAPAVILADGGFLGDPAQAGELAPGTAVASWISSGGGRGVALAREAGLDLLGGTAFSYAPAVEEKQGRALGEPPAETLVILDREVFLFSELQENELVRLLLESPSQSAYLLVPEAGLKPKQKPDWPRYSGIDAFMERYRLRMPELNRRIRLPEKPIFGCRVKAVAVYCLGGVAVNNSGVALRNNEPVKGLYALGETAGGLNGKAVVPGVVLTEALVWGRHLGAAATGRQEP